MESAEFSLFSSTILRSHGARASTPPREVPIAHHSFAYEACIEGSYNDFTNKQFAFVTEYELESAQKWLTFPGKHDVKFPLQTILPKVHMLRQVPARTLPRDVEVDRRRRRYAKVKISDLLLGAGISNELLIAPEEVQCEMEKTAFERNFFLPLFVFDDENFDSNSINGWLDTGLLGGERYPLPAWGLVKVEGMDYEWMIVAVYSYDEETFCFNVIDLETDSEHRVYRIQLMFMAESPYMFVDRIKYALNQRKLCESTIRYQIVLDCVLFDGAPAMNQPLLDRVYKLSLVRESGMDMDDVVLQSISNEIRLNYQRVMTSFVLQDFLRDHSSQFPFIEVKKPVREKVKLVAKENLELNRKKFTEARRIQRVITLFYVAESIAAMLNAAAECAYIETLCLFSYIITKALALPDFLTVQENNCSTVVKYLKYVWPENLSGKICLCLRSIGKGWLDLNVSDWNVFNVAKISRFFLQVKFRMQESLQMLLEKSILNYSHLLNDPCDDFLPLQADYAWSDDLINTPFDRLHLPPVFKLILQINADGPFYSTDPLEFEPSLTKLLYNSLMSTCGIHIIDPDSLLYLHFAKNLYIYTVELIEEMYIEHDAKVHASYSKAVIPLNAYLKKYERFVEFHELVVDDFIAEFAAADKPSQEVKNEIIWQKEQKEELRAILPETITIGSFQVIVEPLKKYLVNKRIEIIRKLFIYYVDRMYAINEALLEELQEIDGRLHEKLVSIEHLFEIKDYMLLVPEKLVVLRERIQVMMFEYNVLDYFFYNLTDSQFGMKWEAFAWPYKITKRLAAMKEEQKVDIEEFRRIQIREMASFQERLESLNEEISTFSLQFDPDKALEVAVDAKKTWKAIQEQQKVGLLLQYRQELFEADHLSLDYLDSIIESFTPYRNMWTACSDFIKLQEMTVGNPLNTVDMEDTRVHIEELKKILQDSVEIFKEKEEVQGVAIEYLKRIEEFNPTLECMDWIKNENWLLMHWAEFSHKSGIEIKYSMAMNFAYCIKKGILNHVELVKDIGERAVREADDIRRAMEEEERQRIEAELALLAKKANRKCRTDIL